MSKPTVTTRRQALALAAVGAAATLPITKAVAQSPNVVGVWRIIGATATDLSSCVPLRCIREPCRQSCKRTKCRVRATLQAGY